MSELVAADLRAARALVAQGWCKDAFARRRDGSCCDPLDPQAVRFCMLGAILRAAPAGARRNAAQVSLRGAMVALTLGGFNDAQRSKKQILAAFDKAIAAEEAAP